MNYAVVRKNALGSAVLLMCMGAGIISAPAAQAGKVAGYAEARGNQAGARMVCDSAGE